MTERGDLVERVAAILDPDWFREHSSALNSYPGQHEKYRAEARDKARTVITIVGEACAQLAENTDLDWSEGTFQHVEDIAQAIRAATKGD